VAVAGDAGNGEAAAPRPRGTAASWWWMTASVLLVLGFGGWAIGAGVKAQWAQTFAAGILFAGLGLLTALGSNVVSADEAASSVRFGAFSALLGEDNRISTSKTQAGLWTVVLAWGIAFLLGRHLYEHVPLETVLPQASWDQYLVILGGPFAAAALAKGIVTTKVSSGNLTKTTTTPDQATINQVVQDDGSQTDLVDSQYFLFNIVAIVYFLVQIARTPLLPSMPATLLAATSGAAALYVGNKATSGSDKPVIHSVVKTTVRPGDTITINGSNFTGGASNPNTSARFDGEVDLRAGQITDNKIVAIVPPGTEVGTQHVVVTNAVGNDSDPYDITVVSDAPVIVGLDRSLLSVNADVTIYGKFFISLQAPAADTVAVLFDGTLAGEGPVDHRDGPDGTQSVTMSVPAFLAGHANTMITVSTAAGVPSASFTALIGG
jgi:IPT/TIG domain